MKQGIINTLKFILRVALLVGIPILISKANSFTGDVKLVFDAVLPVALPIIDKYIHEDPRIPIKGLLPF
jgi:hypothetical protein